MALRLVEGELVFQPSLDELRHELARSMRALLAETAGVPQLQPGSLVRYHLPEAWLGTLRTEDERFLHAQAQLHVLLDASLQRPLQLHQMLLAEFAELAALDEAAYLDGLQQQKLDLDAYGAAITKWRDTARRAGAACPADVHCRLLLVRCSELKEALAEKATALAVGVGGLVAKELHAIAEGISGKYEAIHARLEVSSSNAEEVTAMKEYLASCSVELLKHQEAIDSELSTRWALLSSFHHGLPDETFDAVQRTLGWPAKLDRVVADAEKQAQEDREAFMEALRQERDRFAEELEAWELEIKALSALGEMADTEANADLVAQLQAKLEQGRLRAAENNSREELFGWPTTEYPQLNELSTALEPYLNLWTTAVNFQRAFPVWMEGPLLNLSPEQVENDVGSWSRQLYKMQKALVGLEGPLKVVAHVKLKLDEFSQHIPLLQCILNPGMRERHWKKLAEKTGSTSAQPTGVSTLFSLLEQNVGEHLEAINEQSDIASKEMSLEKTLDKMLAEWKPIDFDCMPYRDTGTYILRGLDEIQSLFDDHIVKTQAMRSSPFVKPFELRMREWETKLVSMQEIIDEWLKCQSVWLYLEPIFASEDIMRQMPTEAKRFTQVALIPKPQP